MRRLLLGVLFLPALACAQDTESAKITAFELLLRDLGAGRQTSSPFHNYPMPQAPAAPYQAPVYPPPSVDVYHHYDEPGESSFSRMMRDAGNAATRKAEYDYYLYKQRGGR